MHGHQQRRSAARKGLLLERGFGARGVCGGAGLNGHPRIRWRSSLVGLFSSGEPRNPGDRIAFRVHLESLACD